MKTRPVTISIPNPCTRYISEGTELPGGRSYCGACEKTLVNYYEMSDEELIAFLRNRSSIPCGVYRKDQLDRTFELPLPQQPARKRLLWLVSLCLLGVAGAAQPATKPASGNPSAIVKPTAKPPRFITGRVLNTANLPVEGASIRAGDKIVFTRTGKDGSFRIDTQKFPGETLDVSHPFYSDCRVTVSGSDPLEVVLQPKLTITATVDIPTKGLPDDDRYTAGRDPWGGHYPGDRVRPVVVKMPFWSRFRLVFTFGRKKP